MAVRSRACSRTRCTSGLSVRALPARLAVPPRPRHRADVPHGRLCKMQFAHPSPASPPASHAVPLPSSCCPSA
eukprot:4215983-Alexandrium_andersonii.AAC.1